MSSSCIIPANPDVAGIGVRIAIYIQNLLCFIPAVWAIWDGDVSDYELESIETQSTTNLIMAFAILISCIVQAFTQGLTNYHANAVLSMSWINNTNAFIYFLLYVHYKGREGPGRNPVKPQWSAWSAHLKTRLRTFFYLSDGERDSTAFVQCLMTFFCYSQGPRAVQGDRQGELQMWYPFRLEHST